MQNDLLLEVLTTLNHDVLAILNLLHDAGMDTQKLGPLFGDCERISRTLRLQSIAPPPVIDSITFK